MKWLLCIIVTLYSFAGLSQTPAKWVLKGYIADKDTRQILSGASAKLLRTSDSSLAASTYTDNKGSFMITGRASGYYILHLSYLGYETLQVLLSPGHIFLNPDTLFLQKTGLTLNAVEIKESKSPVAIKHDTVEYNAGAFKTRENALLEELLKRLPGVWVEKDGTISFYGQPIKKLLIDGVPFFGGDPVTALKNLPAGMIDKVQLLDKKPEFADAGDGTTERVINLTMKEKMKKGFFGRYALGYGTDRRFAGKGSLNRFNDKEQLSLTGAGSNINNADFLEGPGNGINQKGISHNLNAGINYNRKFGKILNLSSSYIFDMDRTTANETSARKNIFPDTAYYYNQNIHGEDKNAIHKITSRLEYKPDSLNSLTVAVGLNMVNNHNSSENWYETLNETLGPVNNGVIDNTKKATDNDFYVASFFDRKFAEKGRSVHSIISYSNKAGSQEYYNQSNTVFKQEDGTFLSDTLNLLNAISNNYRRILLLLAYTEPVFKDQCIELSANFTSNRAYSGKSAFDYNNATGKYSLQNDSLSNAFSNIVDFYYARFRWLGKMGNFNYGAGLNAVYTNIHSRNLSSKNNFYESSVTLYPNVFLRTMFSEGKRFNFNYSAYLLPPTIEQLQPVLNNNNPLYIQTGNPDLKMALGHNAYIGYEALNSKKLYSFSANINTTFIRNKVVNAKRLDSLGRQEITPVNANGAYTIKATVTNAFPLKKANTTINSTTELSFDHDIVVTNSIKGTTQNRDLVQSIGCTYFYKELFDLAFSGSIHYGAIGYSVQKENNTNYLTYAFSLSGNFNLPVGFTAGLYLDYQLTAGRAAGYNIETTLLNGYIGKTVFPRRQGLIRLQAFDLLNQNKSITRIIGENYIEDVRNNVLQQFFMVSFTYYLKQRTPRSL